MSSAVSLASAILTELCSRIKAKALNAICPYCGLPQQVPAEPGRLYRCEGCQSYFTFEDELDEEGASKVIEGLASSVFNEYSSRLRNMMREEADLAVSRLKGFLESYARAVLDELKLYSERFSRLPTLSELDMLMRSHEDRIAQMLGDVAHRLEGLRGGVEELRAQILEELDKLKGFLYALVLGLVGVEGPIWPTIVYLRFDEGVEKAIDLSEGAVILARDPEGAELMVKERGRWRRLGVYDCSVSRPVGREGHAELFVAEGSLFIRDLNSSYGTFVNGERLYPYEPRPLKPGDEVRLATLRFFIRY